MADALAIRFCNEKARVLADELVTCFETTRAFCENFDALEIDKAVAATKERLADGSESDGRPPLDGEQVHLLRERAGALLEWFNEGERITGFRKIACNGAGRF